jgi:hypothetical protein
MKKILFGDKEFILTSFQKEEELEKVVVQNYTKIFGEDTYYFDLKKGIRNKKGDLLTIPDGYLLKINNNPSMTVIENEHSNHDEIKHITVQFAKFHSAITDMSKYNVKKFLHAYLKENPVEEKKVIQLMSKTRFKHISDILESAIMDQEIDYAILIDEKSEELERVMAFFNPEIYVIKKFQCEKDIIYFIEGEDIQINSKITFNSKTNSGSTKTPMRRMPGMDTIVCPAREDGFNDVFLGENRWFAIPLSAKRIPQIEYLAMYEKKPISAIRYIGKVKEIKPYKNTGKYEVVLDGPPSKIRPIKLSEKNPNLAPQGTKYSIKNLFDDAKYLEDIFNV